MKEFVRMPDGRAGVRSLLEVKVNPVNGDAPCLEFLASSGRLDRYGEILEPSGWRLENYRKNPVFQNAHNYGNVLFTIGRAVATEVREAGLYQRIEFATEVNPMARIAYGLYRGGFLSAVSVGFIPVRWENGGERDEWRRKYVEQELVEVSAVAVPANPDALMLGLRSGAVNPADVRELRDLAVMILEGEPKGGSDLVGIGKELRRIMQGA